jgi:VIT1/CCC1 family predicted Fe2+/Mn2+ transporter
MPQTPHVEKHFTSGPAVRDIVIGLSDGLTVPFALAAGLSGVVDSTAIVVTAGLAEIAAGGISMGLGGYLAAKGDEEHYESERRREEKEIVDVPEEEQAEVEMILKGYGLDEAESRTVATALRQRPKSWVDFMMQFELGLSLPDPKRLVRSPITIGGAYVIGGLVPLAPYFFIPTVHAALPYSVGTTLVALFVFGFVKGHFTGVSPWRSGLQTVLIGGVAAAAAFLLARQFAGHA